MKPTGRAVTFLFVAFALWLAANQTQVNWLYVTAALLAAVVPAAWLGGRGALRGLTATRQLNDGDRFAPLHEGDTVTLTLTATASRRPLAQLTLTEACPLAPPGHERARFTAFYPRLRPGQPLPLVYTVPVYQRGVYTFPPLAAQTGFPFGVFRQTATLAVQTAALVYPDVRTLAALDLLDRQPAAQITGTRAGTGNEVLGVRGYQPGDSPRHIHWRSVARTGRLVSKEFAEETQPGVSLVLDRYLPPDSAPHPKHNPFEWGVKAAVSIAAYARDRGYPLQAHADAAGLAPPYGTLTWDALMQYTARVGPQARPALADVLAAGGLRQFVVVCVATPDADLVPLLAGLQNSGANVLVVVPDAATFPGGGADGRAFVEALHAANVDAARLVYGEDADWAAQLAAHRRRGA